jgi:hypothetical protein
MFHKYNGGLIPTGGYCEAHDSFEELIFSKACTFLNAYDSNNAKCKLFGCEVYSTSYGDDESFLKCPQCKALVFKSKPVNVKIASEYNDAEVMSRLRSDYGENL